MTKKSVKTLAQIAQKVKKLESEKDVENFFRSFLTPKECDTLCGRYHLIEKLIAGQPQRDIAKDLNISISQISRGSAELQFGAGRDFFPKFFPEIPTK